MSAICFASRKYRMIFDKIHKNDKLRAYVEHAFLSEVHERLRGPDRFASVESNTGTLQG